MAQSRKSTSPSTMTDPLAAAKVVKPDGKEPPPAPEPEPASEKPPTLAEEKAQVRVSKAKPVYVPKYRVKQDVKVFIHGRECKFSRNKVISAATHGPHVFEILKVNNVELEEVK